MNKHFNILILVIFFLILRINSLNKDNFSEIANKSSEYVNLRNLNSISNENNKKKT